MQREGMKNLYHLPLAVRADRPVGQRSGVLASFTGADISFVGRIYDKKNFYDQIQYLPEWLKGYLEGLMEAQKQVWGYNFQEECIRRKGLKEICHYVFAGGYILHRAAEIQEMGSCQNAARYK